jgi:hypothetical protein
VAPTNMLSACEKNFLGGYSLKGSVSFYLVFLLCITFLFYSGTSSLGILKIAEGPLVSRLYGVVGGDKLHKEDAPTADGSIISIGFFFFFCDSLTLFA